MKLLPHYKLMRACNTWNDLTNPSVAKTEKQHCADNKNARLLKRIIDKHRGKGLLYEASNGALIPVDMFNKLSANY